MTDLSQSVDLPQFSLSLALTNRAARSVVQLFSTGAGDLLLEDFDLREHARSLLREVFDGYTGFSFYLQNGGPGSEGDQIVNLWLATDVESEGNRAVLARTKNWPLVLAGTNRTKGYGNSEFLIIDAATLPPWSSDGATGSLPSRVMFNWTGEYDPGMPADVESRIQALAARPLPRNRLNLLLDDWERFLAITQRLAEAKCFSLDYTSYRLDSSGRTARFQVLVPDGFDIHKVHAAMEEEIHVDKIPEEAKLDRAFAEARGEKYDEDTIQSWPLGTLVKLEGKWLTVELADDVVKQVEHDRQALPKKGTLRYKAVGELAQVHRLRFGLQSLRRGRAKNNGLGSFLFDANEASLPAAAPMRLSPTQRLLPGLNEGQLRAVEGALSAPDLYLIQGPPGTGKTTVIAEICYQVALRGGRTMVASQANLAVDHAMSRLVHHPSIRALRRGHAERVEEEGQPYLEDYVIGTWLDRVAQDCRANLKRQADRLAELDSLMGLDVEIGAFREAKLSYQSQIQSRKDELLRATQSHDAARASLSKCQRQRNQLGGLGEFLGVLQRLSASSIDSLEAFVVPHPLSEACEYLQNHRFTASGIGALASLQQVLCAWTGDTTTALKAPAFTLHDSRTFVDYLRTSLVAKIHASEILELVATLPEKVGELHQACRAWYELTARERPLLNHRIGLRNAQADARGKLKSLQEQISRCEAQQQDLMELAADLPALETALPDWLLQQVMADDLDDKIPSALGPDTRRAIWDSAIRMHRQRLVDLHAATAIGRRLQKEADTLQRIVSHIDQAVGRLLLEVSPTALAAAQNHAPNWRGTSLQNLWTEGLAGVLHPVREAESSIRSLLERILQESLGTDAKVPLEEARIAQDIARFRCLADDLLHSRQLLILEVKRQAQELRKSVNSIAAALVAALASATKSRLREQSAQLVTLHGDQVRAEYDLHLAESNDEDGEEAELQSLARQRSHLRKQINAGLKSDALPPLLPLARISRIARSALAKPEEIWNHDWQAGNDELKRAVVALAIADAATRPAKMIGIWLTISQTALARANEQLPRMKADVGKADAQLQRAEASVKILEDTYQAAYQRWRSACEMLPESERPRIEDIASDFALKQLHDRRQAWMTEREQIQNYLAGHKGFIIDWITRIESRNQRDEADLRQIYIDNANVIGITCVQAGSRAFSERYRDFDTVIIDEVSKATPPELLLPMLKGAKIVLVGDSRQLPPMVGPEALTDLAESLDVDPRDLGHLQRSLFRDIFERAPSQLKTWLTDQYRMHPQIMEAINQFYHDKLACRIEHPDKRRAHGLEPLIPAPTHIAWISTPSDTLYYETRVGTSRRNDTEVEIITNLLSRMNAVWGQRAGDPPRKEVGVITFYAAQERALKSQLLGQPLEHLDLRLGTVDRFQGMEKPVIVVSLVCNNSAGDIGFARELERINVAFSRAQELLVIVGCRELFCRKARAVRAAEHYARVAEVARQSGGLLSVRDFITP